MLTTVDKPTPVLLHETDAGQPCLICQEDCPGLEVHFWRKICINCKCPVSDHQASTNEQITQVRRGKQLDDNVRAQFECGNYSWIPPGVTTDMVEAYMRLLPPEQRPLVGTVGEQFRRKLLMTQLPAHDHNPSDSLTPAQAEELIEFSRLRYELSYGVAEVRHVTDQQAEMFDCRTCQSPLEPEQLAIFTDRAGPACIWCVSCFKCDVCEYPLVDLHYFYKDGELFCGRHHAELLKPRCAACDELILAKEYTLAEEKNWHIDHFCCWECDSPLGGQRYVTRDDHPFCILCYEEIFAPPCKKCQLPIGLDSAHMVHREFHWHATESCFYCENCQVSLITSPFLLKFEEIFCSSACSQEYSVSQEKQPNILIVEDNPVDRKSIQSILRKDSSPTPPNENGVTPPKRKVMFTVEPEQLPDNLAVDKSMEMKRSMSEEEFEYLEKSINQHYVEDSESGGVSESSLSNSPLSETEHPTSPFAPAAEEEETFHTAVEDSAMETAQDITSDTMMECREEEDHEKEDEWMEEEKEDGEQNNYKEGENGEQNKEENYGEEKIGKGNEEVNDEDQENGSMTNMDVADVDHVTPIILITPNEEASDPLIEDHVTEDHVTSEDHVKSDPMIELEDHAPSEHITSERVTAEERVTPENHVTSDHAVEVSEEKPDIESSTDAVHSDKENTCTRNRIYSDSEKEERKPPRKPARGKLSSASFNRVLRKIDHTGNDSLFVERPGKRLKNRPRSMSSLSTHSRPQNTIEQKENLVSMYALAPDIADMVASVYKNQSSINTTTQSAPDTQDLRTLGTSPTGSVTDVTRPAGLHKRNASYEAAEFVMELNVESEGEDAAAAEAVITKHIDTDDSGPITDSSLSSKKGIKQRLSFRKKKNKNTVTNTPQQHSTPKQVDSAIEDQSLADKKRKKQCVVM